MTGTEEGSKIGGGTKEFFKLVVICCTDRAIKGVSKTHKPTQTTQINTDLQKDTL